MGRHTRCSHPITPGPLARTFHPHLPLALPASCQGTFLCVFPLGASLVREMFFCEKRGTGWDLPCVLPQMQQVVLRASQHWACRFPPWLHGRWLLGFASSWPHNELLSCNGFKSLQTKAQSEMQCHASEPGSAPTLRLLHAECSWKMNLGLCSVKSHPAALMACW